MSYQRTLYIVIIWICSCHICQNAVAANSFLLAPCDTLIIDGDTIYVEKEEILFSPDSFPSSSPGFRRVRPARWCAALAAGIHVSRMSSVPYSEDQPALNNFLDRPYKPLPGWTFSADAGARFLTLKGSVGTIEVAGITGLALHQARFQFASIENPSELAVDSTIAFKDDNGELLLQYFTLTEPPNIGEVDSIYPQLAEAEIRFGLRDVSAKFRATFYRKPQSIRYFVETGVIKRYVEMTTLTHDFYYIENYRAAIAMNETRWRVSNVLVPHFAFGVEKTLQTEGIADRPYWTLGTIMQFSTPAATVMRSELFAVELQNFSLAIYGRFFF